MTKNDNSKKINILKLNKNKKKIKQKIMLKYLNL